MARVRRPADDDRQPTKTLVTVSQPVTPFVHRCLLMLVLGLLLSGCMIASGEQTSSDTPENGGNLSTTFVSAEGSEERTLSTGAPGELNVITIVTVSQGSLQIELLDPQGSVIYAVQGRPQEQVTKSGNVPTDAEGRLRYRVSATGARNGGFQILYQRQ